ncbi:MAG: hypothetical protein H0V45_06240 [Actinobacteria bacterium]|nr:hypothetical protein [Actinomycetota bacterium]
MRVERPRLPTIDPSGSRRIQPRATSADNCWSRARISRAERIAGLFVVLAILTSALVALYQSIARLIDPQPLTHLWVLAAAGAIGFIGNEIAAYIRV